MKKISSLLTILFAVSFATHAQTVGSANIMGYTKITTPAAGSFDIVTFKTFGINDTVDLQDAVGNVDGLNASATYNSADQIFVWNGTGYEKYGLYAGASNYWMVSTSLGWSKSAFAAPSSKVIERGQSTWLRTGTGGTSTNLLISGDVPSDGTYDVSVYEGFTLIAYPFSSTINLQDLVITNATAAITYSDADQLFAWNGTGYEKYAFYAGTSNYWMISTSLGWSKSAFAAPTSKDLDLGKGVWYKSGTAKTIGFTQNYTID